MRIGLRLRLLHGRVDRMVCVGLARAKGAPGGHDRLASQELVKVTRGIARAVRLALAAGGRGIPGREGGAGRRAVTWPIAGWAGLQQGPGKARAGRGTVGGRGVPSGGVPGCELGLVRGGAQRQCWRRGRVKRPID